MTNVEYLNIGNYSVIIEMFCKTLKLIRRRRTLIIHSPFVSRHYYYGSRNYHR